MPAWHLGKEHTRAEGAEGTYTRRRRGARTKLFPLGGSLREESPGPVGNAGGVTPLEHELRESGPGPCKFRLAATRGTAGQTPRGRGRRSPGATPEECAPTPRRSFRGGTKPGLCACCSLGPSRCALEWAFALRRAFSGPWVPLPRILSSVGESAGLLSWGSQVRTL